MEDFWQYGDLAQTIAFPFEVIGCALVAWEIFTDWGKKIEEGLDDIQIRFNRFYNAMPIGTDEAPSLEDKFFTWVLLVFPLIAIVTIVFNPEVFGNGSSILGVLASMTLLLQIVITGLASKVITFFNRISDGQALGALGFFLALIGLTCELYQYTGLVLEQDCNWVCQAYIMRNNFPY